MLQAFHRRQQSGKVRALATCKLSGNQQSSVLPGGHGNDLLSVGPGGDTLNGGNGADRFVFNRTGGGRDRIEDFASLDRLQINALQFGGGLFANVALRADQWVIDGIIAGSHGQFHYGTIGRVLAWDPDGNGPPTAEQIVRFTTAVSLVSGDFLIR